jgi:hypothetical protein
MKKSVKAFFITLSILLLMLSIVISAYILYIGLLALFVLGVFFSVRKVETLRRL